MSRDFGVNFWRQNYRVSVGCAGFNREEWRQGKWREFGQDLRSR